MGRMGNQMFQLAFAHAASRRLGTGFVLGPGALWEYFDAGAWSRRSVRLARKLAFRARHGREGPDRLLIKDDQDPAEVLAGLRDGVAYGGFFQSERYFAGYEEDVRRLFAVRPAYETAFARRYGDLGPYICMHMRRGDYGEEGLSLPTTFFRDALAAIPERDQVPLIVVSDDPASAREELGDMANARFETNPAIIDLLLLMNANAVIASNSSFSWWGAWLNQRPEVRVVAPQHWLGFGTGLERPRDVIPTRWIQVPVRAERR
jgi:Glycosyl transferase family 11